jgi:hypothetical protein
LSLATVEKVKAAIPVQKDGESALLDAMNLQLPSSIELVELDNGKGNKAEEYIELRNNIVAVQAAMSRTYLERASTLKNPPLGTYESSFGISRSLSQLASSAKSQS